MCELKNVAEKSVLLKTIKLKSMVFVTFFSSKGCLPEGNLTQSKEKKLQKNPLILVFLSHNNSTTYNIQIHFSNNIFFPRVLAHIKLYRHTYYI